MDKAKISDLSSQERKSITAWCMYDWANSGFATSGLAAFFPIYFVVLFKDAMGESASFLGMTFTGSSTWSIGLAASTVIVAISSPILGVIADRVPIKKTLLWIYTIAGSIFAVIAFFSAYTSQPWAWLMGCFILGNIGFAGGLVFYNSFLPHIASRDLLDSVSSRGFATGYIGGGLLLLIHVVFVVLFSNTEHPDLIVRSSIASTGLWWFGWSLWTLLVLKEPKLITTKGMKFSNAPSIALKELTRTFKDIARFKVLLIYLVAYLLFNDGIQTVTGIATAFATDTLRIDQTFIILSLLIIQFVAAIAAMIFSYLAKLITTKRALYVSLIGWVVIVIFGVAIIPLEPTGLSDYEYNLSYSDRSGNYVISSIPELSDSKSDQLWEEDLANKSLNNMEPQGTISVNGAQSLLNVVATSENSAYGIIIIGGPMEGSTKLGKLHPSKLNQGPVDWWPELVRKTIWKPLGFTAEYQWILLGISVGLVMGGSQALSRSLFAQMTPETRSGEFFSFFGFMSRASTVFGPMMYVVATSLFDTRIAVTSIVIIILSGTIILNWVDVKSGIQVADEEDRKLSN